MTIQVTCSCGQMFAAQPFLAGKTVNCPACGSLLNIPAPPPTYTVIRVSCACGQVLQAAAGLSGKRASCPSCGAPVAIPGGATTPKPSVAPAAQPSVKRDWNVTEPSPSSPYSDVAVDLRDLDDKYLNQKPAAARPQVATPLPQISVVRPKDSSSSKKRLIVAVITASVSVGVIVVVSLLLMVLLPAIQAAHGSLSGPWITYRSPEHGFTVAFPRQPQLKTDSGMGVTLSVVSCDLGKSGSLHVATNDIPSVGLNPERILDDRVDRGRAAINGQITLQKEIELDGNPGCEFNITGTRNGATFKAFGRIYVVGNKMYQLQFFDPNGLDSNAHVQKFFNSFRLSRN